MGRNMKSRYTQNIVIDLEFTPAPRGKQFGKLVNEVIEIGAVRVLPDGSFADEFTMRVQPSFGPHVSRTVRRLTGITDADLVEAPAFEQALAQLSAWIGEGSTRIIAWSGSDWQQIASECAAKGISIPSNMTRWLDLQRVYPRVMHVGKKRGRMALSRAASWYGAELDGKRAHSAAYDAHVAACLLQDLLTGSYKEQRAALDRVMRKDNGKVCASTIGSRCGELASLYAQLQACAC